MQSTLDLFSHPPVDSSIENSEDVQILPLSGVTNDTAIDLVVPAQTSQYIDLSKTLLYLKVSVTRADGLAIAKDTAALIPLWPQALFRQIDMYLGQTLVSTSTNQSAYRSYLETILSFSKSVKNDQLKVLEHVDGTPIPATEAKKSCKLEALTRLNLDMLQQSRYLLNGVSVSFRLYRNMDAFLFKVDPGVENPSNLTLTIEDISLFVRHVTPSSSILLDHTRKLAEQTCVYPIDRSWVKTMHITKGMQEETFSNVFMGQLPTRMVIGLVKTSDYSGNYLTDPFIFNHFNLSHISLNVNGKQLPMRALEPNFDGEFRRCYYHLLETVLGPCLEERSIGISEQEYVAGKTLFGFTISPDGNNNHALSPRLNGNINLHIKFRRALESNITVIVYSELQNKIEIDAARNVYTDYGF